MTSNQVKMQSDPWNWETPQTLEILVTGAVDALCAPCLGLRAETETSLPLPGQIREDALSFA